MSHTYMNYGNGTFTEPVRYRKIVLTSVESELNSYFFYESDCAAITIIECQPFKTQRRITFHQACSLAAILMSRVIIFVIETKTFRKTIV